jgi:transposase InsO family protein
LELANRLSDWGLSASFGSTGDAYDNAAMESFWATAKREIEFLHGTVRQLTRSQLRCPRTGKRVAPRTGERVGQPST